MCCAVSCAGQLRPPYSRVSRPCALPSSFPAPPLSHALAHQHRPDRHRGAVRGDLAVQRGAGLPDAALADEPVDLDWFTTREREHAEVLPWDHLDSGLDREWLWQDWQDALDEEGVEDCRWTPCFDCGVCDQMGTSIQVGPTDLGLPDIRIGQPGVRVGQPA